MDLDLEVNKAIEKIKEEKAKLVCLQFPDGLKPQATKIAREIEEKTNAKVIIWLGSCWGACDLPVGIDKLKVDLLIQLGHSKFGFEKAISEYEKSLK